MDHRRRAFAHGVGRGDPAAPSRRHRAEAVDPRRLSALGLGRMERQVAAATGRRRAHGRSHVSRAAGVTEQRRAASLVVEMGPLLLDFTALVAVRLNEHALHTWDVDVALNPDVVIPDELVAPVVDQLETILRFTAKPTGASKTITVGTTNPVRRFTVSLTPERATVAPADGAGTPDVTLPAEEWIRLVYGRLDPGDDPVVQELVRVFPGP